jgi:hypothetical protein
MQFNVITLLALFFATAAAFVTPNAARGATALRAIFNENR